MAGEDWSFLSGSAVTLAFSHFLFNKFNFPCLFDNKQILATGNPGDHFELRNLGNEFGFEESLLFAFFYLLHFLKCRSFN